jgi:hypothetical protein
VKKRVCLLSDRQRRFKSATERDIGCGKMRVRVAVDNALVADEQAAGSGDVDWPGELNVAVQPNRVEAPRTKTFHGHVSEIFQ